MTRIADAEQLVLGIDVGSTTVKGVVADAVGGESLWSDYQRHDTRQAEKVLEFLQVLEETGALPTPGA